MANIRKGEHQKLKMLYLMKIFNEETDDAHPLTMNQIIEKLAAYGVNANRKTLYQDFQELQDFGLDITMNRTGKQWTYNVGSRLFELAELKLLVDSIQSAKFITDKKSKELIGKLESLASHAEAKQLNRQVIIAGRVKTMNEKIYYNVDRIHEAINADKQIEFYYYQWTIHKEMKKKKETKYHVSPWALMWDDENYYLVGFDAQDQKIKHYRVDKMKYIEIIPHDRQGKEPFKKFRLPNYTKSLFGMFGGKECHVTLRAKNDMVGVLIDRFGKDIAIEIVDPGHIQTTVYVAVSQQFLGWIIALGNQVKIIGPDDVVQQMKALVQSVSNQYQD